MDQDKPVSYNLKSPGEIVRLMDFYELERICDRILENKISNIISNKKIKKYVSQINELVSLKLLLDWSREQLSIL